MDKFSHEVFALMGFEHELPPEVYAWFIDAYERAFTKTIVKNSQKPGMYTAYLRYKELMKEIDTEAFMKGEAFGL
jgi:hypothetical protein